MRTARTVRFLFTRLLLPTLAVVVVAVVMAQKSGIESSYRYDDSGSLVKTETTYKEGHVVEKKEFDKAGKLRKRTTYTYLKGFKDPNTSTTEYAPDGETPKSTTNVDHDKDGSPTSTVTTNYDGAGKETGGSKRERDAVTGKERCYNWNAAKQVYEEIECPKLYVSQVSMNSFVPQGGAAPANVRTADGLRVVTFSVNPGTIKVNLPADIMAGDTISGTVVAEPKGDSNEERAANGEKLKGLVVIIRQTRIPVESVTSYQAFMITLPGTTASGAVITPDPKITVPTHPSGAVITPDPKITTPPGMTPSGAVITPDPKITPSSENLDPTAFRPSFFDVFVELDPSGTSLGGRASIPVRPSGQQPGMTPSGAVITPDPKITVPTTPSGAVITPDPKITVPTTPSGAVITPDPKITPNFNIPPLGQTGRPILISGLFDGNSTNTEISFQPTVGEARSDLPGVGGWADFSTVAESPRQAVVTSPSNITGPIQIRVNENGLQTIGNYRNVGVNLSAPKTNLLKGEKTELRVEVNGLEGLKQPVPLTITYRGVILMEGGPYQPLLIQPSQVSADGRYSTTRGITGIEAGGWTATATVVTSRFDFCLQDDAAPARAIQLNTFTGDYSFICPSCFPQRTGETAQTGGAATTVAPPGSPATALTGTGTMVRKGCIITLTHNAPDRRVFSRLDVCTNSGSSTVEVPKTNAKFTITDRNMADNTCPSQ